MITVKHRRANGEGTKPRKRPDGRWQAKIWVEEPDGRRARRTVNGKTEGAVVDKILDLRNRVRRGENSTDSRITVKAFLEGWLENTIRPARKASTYYDYKSALTNHVIKQLGNQRLASLTPDSFEAFLAEREKAKVGATTRNKLVTIMRRALKHAERRGTVTRNIALLVDKPRSGKKPMRPLMPKEAAALFDAAVGDRHHAIYVLAVAGGMRQGEILALRWMDIDFARKAVSVQANLVQRTMEIDSAKTVMSQRLVPVEAPVIAALRAHQKAMEREGHSTKPDALVFVSTRGKALSASNLQRDSWNGLRESIGTPDVQFRDLRHTFATLMLAGGAHPKVVSELMGHESPTITMKTYSHLLAPVASRELNVVRRFLPLPKSAAPKSRGAQRGASRSTADVKKKKNP